MRKLQQGGPLQLRGAKLTPDAPPLQVGMGEGGSAAGKGWPRNAYLYALLSVLPAGPFLHPQAQPYQVPSNVYTRLLQAQPPTNCLPNPTTRLPHLQVSLFIGNVLDDDEAALRQELSQYGMLVRCFIMRNPSGDSKQYAFAEYATPTEAAAAVKAMDARCKEQQSAAYRQQQEGAGGEGARPRGPPPMVSNPVARAHLRWCYWRTVCLNGGCAPHAALLPQTVPRFCTRTLTHTCLHPPVLGRSSSRVLSTPSRAPCPTCLPPTCMSPTS